jgi:hypothetical protein
MSAVPPRVDLDEVAHLVEQLERDLSRVRAGGGDVDTLRAEVEQLRQALAADAAPADVHQGLHGVRERLAAASDEIVKDAFKGGDYLARIGRMLGLG